MNNFDQRGSFNGQLQFFKSKTSNQETSNRITSIGEGQKMVKNSKQTFTDKSSDKSRIIFRSYFTVYVKADEDVVIFEDLFSHSFSVQEAIL